MRQLPRWLALVFVLCACSMPTMALAEKRVALVIGNSSYQSIAHLPNPQRDAAAVGDLLKGLGFAVQLRLDADIKTIRSAVRDFAGAASDADVSVVYFAGHGIEMDGTNYIVPTDAKLDRDFDVEDEAFSLDRVLRAIEPARKLRLVILDACRDNPFIVRMKRTAAVRSVGRGLSRIEPASADTLVAYAAKAGTVAADGAGMHSPFTAALIGHLGTPDLDLRIVLGRVRDEVMKATANKQEPFVYGSLGGGIVTLATRPSAAEAAAPQTGAGDADSVARAEYAMAVQVGTVAALDAFLARHASGFYADLARGQRERLANAGPAVAPARVPAASGALAIAAPVAPVGPAFEAYRGRTLVVSFRQLTHEVAPRPGVWPINHRYRIDVKSEGDIATAGTFIAERTGLQRSFNSAGGIGPTDGLDSWSLQDDQLAGNLRRRGFVLKLGIRLTGKSCVATVGYQKLPGQDSYKLVRWTNGETMTVASLRAENVSCRLEGEPAATARRVQQKR